LLGWLELDRAVERVLEGEPVAVGFDGASIEEQGGVATAFVHQSEVFLDWSEGRVDLCFHKVEASGIFPNHTVLLETGDERDGADQGSERVVHVGRDLTQVFKRDASLSEPPEREDFCHDFSLEPCAIRLRRLASRPSAG